MATISDPQLTKFCNEIARPLCEAGRNMRVVIDTAKGPFGSLTAKYFTVDSGGNITGFQTGYDANTVIDDGRQAEGVQQFTLGTLLQLQGCAMQTYEILLAEQLLCDQFCVRQVSLSV